MNIYIDCGALNGDTLDCEKRFNFKADYKIAFEPNPDFFDVLITKDVDEVNQCAVWDKQEVIDFSVDINSPPYGSTAIPSKKTWESGRKIKVKTVDFAEYIKDLHGRLEASKILIKMDIEGSEFRVLEHLKKTGADKLIYKMYIEFHEHKITEYHPEDKERLIKQLACEIVEWK